MLSGMTSPLRIQVVSDLHVDVAATELRLASRADVLVVAGDTCEGVERGFAWLGAAVPSRAAWSIAYAPGTNLERLDAALLAIAQRSIDMAAYILTDVPVIDALAMAGARGVHVRLYHDPGGPEPHGAAAEALARLAAAPTVKVRFKARGAPIHLKFYLVDGRVLRGGAAELLGIRAEAPGQRPVRDGRPGRGRGVPRRLRGGVGAVKS